MLIKISFITYGCKVNYVETSTLERKLLLTNDYKKVSIKEYPDIVIINSCAVTEKAEKECVKLIKYLLNLQDNILIVIIGCLVKIESSKLKSFKNIHTFKSINEITDDILKQIINHKDDKKDIKIIEDTSKCMDYTCNNQTESLFSLGDRTRSFLKIQDGCNYYCSYCTIPLARGHSRSPEIDEIIHNIEILVSKNIKEIVLTGINIGDYGIINGKRKYHFYDLLQTINDLQYNIRYRISSIEPNLLTDEIIDLIKNSTTIVNHLHIPLQSGDDKILKLMHRRYSVDEYVNKILLVKSKIDNCCIGADVICGYPGEDDQCFMNTYKVLESLPISYFHVFPYSIRPNTLASNNDNQIDKSIKEQRVKKLLGLSKIKKTNYYKQNLGKIVNVLFEHSVDKNGYIYGYSQNYLRVKTKFNEDLVNKIHPVVVKNIDIKNLHIYFDNM